MLPFTSVQSGSGPDLPSAPKRISCELALCVGIALMALSVVLVAKSDLGFSTIDLFYYSLWQIFPQLSFGTWANLFHVIFLAILILLMRRIKLAYVFTFVVAFGAGRLIDLYTFLLAPLPSGTLVGRILYFLAGFLTIVIGLSVTICCRLPIYPFDYFTREVSQHFGIPFKYLRTSLDLFLLFASLALGWFVIGGFPGLGGGTIVFALFVGISANQFMRGIRKRFVFTPTFRFSRYVIDAEDEEVKL
ncbi:DUF6198 family protein [Ruminococcaceae bacterium OttesenSCG-928-I18]|nr:DUF6198 family protein [Ruminococcaceae bacterium OttesenSCG-928-I18]